MPQQMQRPAPQQMPPQQVGTSPFGQMPPPPQQASPDFNQLIQQMLQRRQSFQQPMVMPQFPPGMQPPMSVGPRPPVPYMPNIDPSTLPTNSSAPSDPRFRYAAGGPTYAAGGKLLRGPGDGMSDSIPAVIGGTQRAALADGEFVMPADVVAHLGNGSTTAGAGRLYEMMDRVRKARTGSTTQPPAVNMDRLMPA